jgi:hypoxanthine phosphoribosyltransferase
MMYSSGGQEFDSAMRVLITEEQIRQRVIELGAQLSQEYQGRPLTILGVLTGSVVLLADLIRPRTCPCELR